MSPVLCPCGGRGPFFLKHMSVEKEGIMTIHLPQIMVMGLGCTLLSDEGFGIRVIQTLEERYKFPDHVELVDGAMLGVRMTGYLARVDNLIVVDAVCNNGYPGQIYQWEDQEIPKRLLKKNTVQHVDFIEAFIHCHAIDSAPGTIVIAVEPDDTRSLDCRLSPLLERKIDVVIDLVLKTLGDLNVEYSRTGFEIANHI